MAFDYFQLPRAVTYPFPPDGAQTFITEHYALAMRPIYEDAMARKFHQPPNTPQYRLYKNYMRRLFDQKVVKKKKDLEEMHIILNSLTLDVFQSQRKFVEMFLDYNKMVKEIDINYKDCREKSFDGIRKFKEMVRVQRKHKLANQSLLFIKDAMGEAVDTYKEAEAFLKKAGKDSIWESPERLQNRFSKLVAIKDEIRKQEEKEIAACQTTLDEMHKIQQSTIEKHTLLLSRARYLARLIQDADEGILKLESEETLLTKAKDRAWRDYSIINTTIHDLSRGLVESRDLNPKLLEGGLKERLELVRREHALNKEVLRRWGERRRAGDRELEADLGPGPERERTFGLRRDWEGRKARLREIVLKYRGHPLPDKLTKYLVWLRRENPQFPPPDQIWEYLASLAGVGTQHPHN